MPNSKCIIITGATATGKTRLAVQLAHRFNGEIISADSRQVYRGMDIGTGKDLNEYTVDGHAIPYHLIDIVPPTSRFDLHGYVNAAWHAYDEILSRHHLPIICGGSPLYILALIDGYNLEGGEPDLEFRRQAEAMSLPELVELLKQEACPELFDRTDKTQKRRIVRAIEIARTGSGVNDGRRLDNPLILAPLYPRSVIHQRIEQRLDERLKAGMIDEIKQLHESSGVSWEQLDWFGLEYRFVGKYLSGELNYDEMRYQLLCHIRQFCKRQEIWFRRMERDGKVIHRIPNGDINTAIQLINTYI